MAPQTPSWQTLLGMGAVNAALLVVGIALGWLVDSMLNTVPIFILVGVALGIVADVAYTTVRFRQFLKS
jgi:F0F1-type ATP synthase assembly protein I